jgi:protein-tyrosine-phosphatase
LYRILIVCTGNVCRSAMGEGILKHVLARHGLAGHVEVRSAGTWASSGLEASHNAVRAAAAHSVHIEDHHSTVLTRSLIRQADLILVMEPVHLEEVLAQDPSAEGRAFVLTSFADPEEGEPGGIEDPFGTDQDRYDASFEQIDHMMRMALPRILSLIEEANVRAASKNEGDA